MTSPGSAAAGQVDDLVERMARLARGTLGGC